MFFSDVANELRILTCVIVALFKYKKYIYFYKKQVKNSVFCVFLIFIFGDDGMRWNEKSGFKRMFMQYTDTRCNGGGSGVK